MDVTVIGGGPAGSSAAIILARAGLKTLLVESTPVPAWKIGETLAPEARPLLELLGVWKAFQLSEHLPSFGSCSAWGMEEMASKEFIFNPYGCGWQLDRPRFEQLLQDAAQSAGVALLRGSAARNFERDGEHWRIVVGGKVIRTRWLIDASGRRAVVARHLGQSRFALDELVTVYAIDGARNKKDSDSRTLIEARPDGWWYSALMPGGRRTVSWQTDADLISENQWKNPGWLFDRIQDTRHIRELFVSGDALFAQVPHLTSARSGQLSPCLGDGWIAVGDAAQSFDPLSGQGLINALLTGHRAAQALINDWPRLGESMRKYQETLQLSWETFIVDRKLFYRSEKRWSQRPFWQRRS